MQIPEITGHFANKSYILPCLTQIALSQPTNHTSYHASHRYQPVTGNKSHILPCLTQIPANHRQQIVHLTMHHTDTRKSQAILPTNRTSHHASHRYQQITGNKSYILQCLTQIPANHRQQVVLLTMPHTDTRKSQATNRTSHHASHRYQQITGNKSYILQCFIQIPENHRPSCQQIVHLAMPHTDTSKSQALNRTSYHASHRYQQITGNKSYILPCLTQIPANHRQQIVHLTMLHTETHLANKSYILPCLTLIPANHSQQVALLAMPHTDTSKSQATNRTSYHASHRYQQITGNKS